MLNQGCYQVTCASQCSVLWWCASTGPRSLTNPCFNSLGSALNSGHIGSPPPKKNFQDTKKKEHNVMASLHLCGFQMHFYHWFLKIEDSLVVVVVAKLGEVSWMSLGKSCWVQKHRFCAPVWGGSTIFEVLKRLIQSKSKKNWKVMQYLEKCLKNMSKTEGGEPPEQTRGHPRHA